MATDGAPERGFSYGCLFCRTGSEDLVAREMERACPEGIRAMVAKKALLIRIHGELKERTSTLFPGYVFFKAPSDFRAHRIRGAGEIYGILSDADGRWALSAVDAELVSKFYEYGGRIGISKVYYEGDRIRAVSGMLREYEGCIVRVNARKSKAQVRFEIGGKTILTWLGFEEIQRGQGAQGARFREKPHEIEVLS